MDEKDYIAISKEDFKEIIEIINKIKENEDKANFDIKYIDEKLTSLYGYIKYSKIKNKLLAKIFGINLKDELEGLKRYISEIYSYIIICNGKNIEELERKLGDIYFISQLKEYYNKPKDG